MRTRWSRVATAAVSITARCASRSTTAPLTMCAVGMARVASLLCSARSLAPPAHRSELTDVRTERVRPKRRPVLRPRNALRRWLSHARTDGVWRRRPIARRTRTSGRGKRMGVRQPRRCGAGTRRVWGRRARVRCRTYARRTARSDVGMESASPRSRSARLLLISVRAGRCAVLIARALRAGARVVPRLDVR